MVASCDRVFYTDYLVVHLFPLLVIYIMLLVLGRRRWQAGVW